jgi:hypothetical protein
VGLRARRLADEQQQHRDGDGRRDHGDPEDGAERIGRGRHQRDREQRPGERADGVERLPETEGCAASPFRREVGDQSVARRAAQAFADTVEPARREDPAGAWREREQGLRQRREPVPRDRQQLALAEPVAERARKHFRDLRDSLGRPFEQADGGHARAEADEEYRQKRVDHL